MPTLPRSDKENLKIVEEKSREVEVKRELFQRLQVSFKSNEDRLNELRAELKTEYGTDDPVEIEGIITKMTLSNTELTDKFVAAANSYNERLDTIVNSLRAEGVQI